MDETIAAISLSKLPNMTEPCNSHAAQRAFTLWDPRLIKALGNPLIDRDKKGTYRVS